MPRLPHPPRRRRRSTFRPRQAEFAPTAFWESLPVIQVDSRDGQCRILPPPGGQQPDDLQGCRVFRLVSMPEGTSAIASVALAPVDQDAE